MKSYYKRTLYLLCIIILIQIQSLKAQEFDWANRVEGSLSDATNDVVVDASGNVISVGRFQGTLDLDPGPGITNVSSSSGPLVDTDGFIYKANSAGQFQWGFSIGNGQLGAGSSGPDQIFAVDVDGSGNIYITGVFAGIVNFNPLGSASNLTSTCNPCSVNPSFTLYNGDAFWAKYDPNGILIAAFSWGDNGYDQGLDIKVSSTGDTYIVGQYEGTVDFDPGGGVQNRTSVGGHDIFVARYNTSNQLSHILSFGSTATTIFTDFGTGIDVDASGNYYVSGHFTGNMNLNPNGTATNVSSSSNADGFLAKYNASGILQWGFDIGSSNIDKVNDCVIDASNNVYITGEFAGDIVDFDPDPIASSTLGTNGNADIFVAKYSGSGDHNWSFSIGSPLGVETGNSITLDDEAIFVGGKFNGTANFNPGGNNNLTSNVGANGFVASYDFAGAYRWAGGLITSTSSGSEVFAVDINANDQLALGGEFAGTADFDIESGTTNLSGVGGTDAFTSAYTSLCISTSIAVDVANLGGITSTCSETPSTPTATDACGNPIDGVANVSFPITAFGTTTITWTYTDGNGNETSQTQDVTIEDDAAPVPDVGTLPDLVDECSVDAPTVPTATDNCAGSIDGVADVSFPVTTPGTTVVTWSFEDENGNTSTQEQNVIIEDVSIPVPDVADLADINAECAVDVLTAPTASDNCDGSIEATSDATLPITTNGLTLVTWTYTDAAGNTITQEQNVVIADVTAPVASLSGLSDINTDCSVDVLTAPTADDNCDGSIEGVADVTFPIVDQGETIVTWTYEDSEGNTSTQTQRVVITDVTPPTPVVSDLQDIISDTQVEVLTAPTATDNCGQEITGTTDTTFPITDECTTVVTWVYEDVNGNIATQEQNVIISDNTAPVVDVAQLLDITGECSVLTVTAPTATDACDGAITGETATQFPINTPGTTTITWSFEDNAGNITTQTQDIVITDGVAPVPNVQSLADVVETCQVFNITPPTATDNCLGIINGEPDVEFPITAVGMTIITWTFEDGAGNKVTQQQSVTIQDNEVPVPDVVQLPVVYTTCDGVMESLATPTATDNCAGALTATTNQSFPFVAVLDTTTIVWMFDDGNGNQSIQAQKVVQQLAYQINVDTAICETSTFTFPDGTSWDGITMTHVSNLTTSLGCDSTITTNLTVQPIPEVDLGIDTLFYCAGETLAFGIDESQVEFDTYRIFSGVGEAVDDSLKLVVSEQQALVLDDNTVIIELTGTTGCVAYDTVRLFNNAIVNLFQAFPTVNDPQYTFTIAFLPETVDEWYWDFGDGTTVSGDENPTHTYTENGFYEACLIATNECDLASMCFTIEVMGACPISDNTVSESNGTLTANASGFTYQWIDCGSGQAVAGATGQSFAPTVSGSNAVEISDGTCTVTSACMQVEVAPLGLTTTKLVSIYPNPVAEKLLIKSGTLNFISATVLNTAGKEMIKTDISKKREVDVKSLSSGVYFLLIEGDEIVEIHRFIKK